MKDDGFTFGETDFSSFDSGGGGGGGGGESVSSSSGAEESFGDAGF